MKAERIAWILLGFLLWSTPGGEAWGIPGHTLSLETVLQQCHRVVVARILERSRGASDHGSVTEYRFAIEEYAWGQGGRGRRSGRYFEAWPHQAPDGKVEAPIWTGSGIEHNLAVGTRVLLVLGEEPSGTWEHILRAEPLQMREEIVRMLRGFSPPERPSPSPHGLRSTGVGEERTRGSVSKADVVSRGKSSREVGSRVGRLPRPCRFRASERAGSAS